MNIDGFGELETVLRQIAKADKIYAECLNGWKECLKIHTKKVSQKEFDKFWVQIYQRYDCCSKEERKQAGKKCSNEASMKKDIWDFDHVALCKLKSFLNNL